MPPVGRPRSRTRAGSSPPTNELGVPDVNMSPGISLAGGLVGWTQFQDQHEFVEELRWPQSIPLYDQMRTDTQLAALFTAVAWGIAQLRYIIDPNEARPAIVKGISEDLNLPIRGQDDQPRGRLKKRFSHSKFISEALLALIYGHMYYEQVGTIENGLWRLRKLAARMPQSIENIKVAEDGGLISIVQYRPMNRPMELSPPEIPVDRLMAFVFQQEGPNWVGRSMFRDCYKDWLIKDRLVRIDAINHERAGGVPYVEAPPGATPGEIEDLNQMAQKFRIGESSGGALPYGARLEIARGTGTDVDQSIHSRDESMARRFLLQLMNLAQSGQHVGSYALGETFEDFFIVGQRHIAQWYCDTVTEHLIEDWVDWNYGEDEELVPQITWERTSEDALGVDQLATLVGQQIVTVDDELENAIRYKYRLPKRTSPRPEPVQPQGAGVGPGAPSSTPVPAPTQASLKPFDWEREPGFGKPQVMASAPSLVTVPNVPILEAGVEYELGTGKTTFTPEDLADAVTAANEDKSIPTPRLKLGHIDPRFNGPEFDATPAFGLAKNLRLNENNTVVYADYVGVPRWLAEILPTAFPNRSVEGFWDVDSQSGRKWKFVLSACSLLGVQWPGITQLEDLPNMYGEEIPEGVVIGTAASQPGGDPLRFLKKSTASANLDDVRRAFYKEYVAQEADAKWWWIRAVLTDPNELVCEDDESGELHKIPFETDDKGNVSFGQAEAVRVEYVPDESLKAAASHLAAALVVGREVLASYESRAESSPSQGGGMDPKEIRQRLNLPEDATDEQVQEAISKHNEEVAALNEAIGFKPKASAAEGTGDSEEEGRPKTQDETTTPAPAVESAAASGPSASGGKSDPPDDGTVRIDRETLANLQAGAQAGLSLKAKQDEKDRNELVAAAIGDGRIPPARKEHWLKALEADFEGNKAVLASLAPGLVPVDERGSNQSEEMVAASGDLETVKGWTDSLFPEVAARRALASGNQRPQIQREEG